MRLLLDTHTLVWWFTDNPSLSPPARAAILDTANEILVSAVCGWEIATKYRLGKFPEAAGSLAHYFEFIAADGFVHLPVSAEHAVRAGSFAVDHRDPFDRLLAAQAELEHLTLVTRDPAFAQFGTRTLW
jgi:PIN domain nuclease of toxin-antitoxin system